MFYHELNVVSICPGSRVKIPGPKWLSGSGYGAMAFVTGFIIKKIGRASCRERV
jgi:hypothetical protein